MNDLPELSSAPQAAPTIERIDHCMHSDPALALALCEQLLELAQRQHDDGAYMLAAERYAKLMDHHGRAAESRDRLFGALQIAQARQQVRHQALLHELIARSYYTAGEYQTATQFWLQCVELAERQGNDPLTWMLAKIGLGQVYDALGDLPAAIELHAAALGRIGEVDDPYLEAKVKINLGHCMARVGKGEQGGEILRQALAICQRCDYADYAAESHYRLAEIDVAVGRIDAAWLQLEQAIALALRHDYRWVHAQALCAQAGIHARRGEHDSALDRVFEAQALAQRGGFVHMLGSLHAHAARHAEDAGQPALALAQLKAAQACEQRLRSDAPGDAQRVLHAHAGLRPAASRSLAELSNSALLDADEAGPALALIAEQACHILGVAGVSIWALEASQMHCLAACSRHAAPQAQAPRLQGSGVQPYLEWLAGGAPLIAHSARQHYQSAALDGSYLAPRGIVSLLCHRLRVAERVVGAIHFEQVEAQHNWTPDEVLLAAQIADIASRALSSQQRAAHQHKINALNASLQEANATLELRVAERTEMLEAANIELRKVMRKLVQSEKLAALGSLVAGIAHEMNTPLGTVRLSATSLSDASSSFGQRVRSGAVHKSDLERFIDECKVAADLIERNAARACALITNFKQVAVDTSSIQRRRFELRQVLDEAVAMLAPRLRDGGHAIALAIPEGIELDSYPGPIAQIIAILISNSLVHGFDGGRQGRIALSAELAGEDKVRLLFHDDGAGIAPELHARVFEPFFTTRMGTGGNGLGLYIVFNLVTGILKGDLTLSSEPGQFTRFELTLPLVA